MCRSANPVWFSQEEHESSLLGWAPVIIALAAVIPILYLLLRDSKAKVFLKPTEFQDLPLEYNEASFDLTHVTFLTLKTISLLLMIVIFVMSIWLPLGREDGKLVKVSLHGPTANH